MLTFRPFLVLLLASATLLLSFRAPAPGGVQNPGLADHWTQNAWDMPLEECQGAEENSSSSQQGPLEEIHDLQCALDRQKMILWMQDDVSRSGLHPLLWMRIPLMSCFQPPELD